MSFWKKEERKQSALIVGMSTTPNQSELPSVDEEIRCLNSLLPNTVTRTVLQMPHTPPTKREVLSELGRSQIAHFACHGESTISDPSQSKLFLSDWQSDPLTVADILSLKLQDPQLAFLSACHGADNRVFDLLDEGIHLAGAFQLAGFPFVIGTLWQIDDEHSVQVSRDVYSDMIRNQETIDVTWGAPALHNAVEKLRDRTRLDNGGEDDPLVWATYIHVGA
jgi:CHAT domain-containing protein